MQLDRISSDILGTQVEVKKLDSFYAFYKRNDKKDKSSYEFKISGLVDVWVKWPIKTHGYNPNRLSLSYSTSNIQ